MTATSKARKAALGVRCHSGWAAVVLISGSHDNVEVVDRRRIELCDPALAGSKQPFHTAEPMPFSEAEGFLARCRHSTEKLAAIALETLLANASSHRSKLVGCGVLAASGRAQPPLKDVLQSHALIHAAEGEFYRDAIAAACEAAKVSIVRIRERDALRQAADRTGKSEADIRTRLATIGKTLGPPWTVDQKLATLAGWVALR